MYRSTAAAASASPSPTTKPAKSSPAPKPAPVDKTLRGTLDGSVTTAGKLVLTLKSKPVTTLKTGRYKLTVLDETSKRGFSLQKDGAKTATSVTTVPYLGRNTILITLNAGKWFYYSPSRGKIAFRVVSG